MTWRERLLLLLGAASPFAVADPGSAAMPTSALPLPDDTAQPVKVQRLDFWSDPAHADHLLQLAAHSSHRSHSSHSSHRSHVSGSGHSSHYSSTTTTRTTPAPVYTPPRPAAPAPAPRLVTPPPAKPPAKPVESTTQSRSIGDTEAQGLISEIKPTTAASERLTQDDIVNFVQRVQLALLIKGYDPGPADGVLTEKTRAALRAYQTAVGLTVTGNIDKDTLHSLGVLK